MQNFFFRKKKYRHLAELEPGERRIPPRAKQQTRLVNQERKQSSVGKPRTLHFCHACPAARDKQQHPPTPSASAGSEASKWLQCSPNTNNLNLQMRNGRLGAPAGRLRVSQPFMEMPKEQRIAQGSVTARRRAGWWSGCILAVCWKGLAFLSVELSLNHRTFRRKKGLKLGSKVKKE